jgi:phosphoglycolate phosphatase
MNRSLIVFDWDGTLIDSAAKIIFSMQAACDDLAVPIPNDEAIKNIIGLGLGEAISALFPAIELELREQIRQQYSARFISADQIPSPIFAGVEELLLEFKEMGFLLAVATGKSRKGLNRVFDQIAWHHMFHSSRCADETCSKPDPLMLHQLLTELEVDSRSALMVGDTEYDLRMAQAANVSAVGVTYGSHSEQRLRACNPIATIDQFTELKAVVLEWHNRR